MSAAPTKIKRRVWTFLGCGVAVSALWWIWAASYLPAPTKSPETGSPVIRLAANDAEAEKTVLGERAIYLDPTPLFFPTEWNYAHGVVRESLKRQPGQVFGSFDAKFPSRAPSVQPYDSDPTSPSRRLAETVLAGNEAPFDGIGQVETKASAVPDRMGYVEVKRLADGKTVVAQALVALPPGNPSDFVPMEFLVVVGTTGLVREPILTSASTPEESGLVWGTYLSSTFRLGSRLAPGLYRVVVGP